MDAKSCWVLREHVCFHFVSSLISISAVLDAKAHPCRRAPARRTFVIHASWSSTSRYAIPSSAARTRYVTSEPRTVTRNARSSQPGMLYEARVSLTTARSEEHTSEL